MKNERYTEAQKSLLKGAPKDLSGEERDFLRRMLLPRKRYLPQSEEEGCSLVRDIVGEQKLGCFCRVREEISARYGAEGRWGAGDSRWRLFYRFSRGGRPFCSFGMDLNTLHLILPFGLRERETFERMRDTFSLLGICWTYDMIAVNGRGYKELKYDVSDPAIREELFRLLDIKAGRLK